MSELGIPPSPGPGVPPSRGRSDQIPLWVVVVAVAVMLAMVGVLAVGLVRAAAAPKGPTFPDHWDARIAPYAAIAERQRGLTFLHPVDVRFLPAAAFAKTVTRDQNELDAKDRTEIRHFTGLMRAFGLITGDVDLFKAFNTVSGSGTLAYYSFEDKRITVRGTKITRAMRSTLVHELTHVLQDQHFDIGDRMKELREQSKKGETTSASSLLESIVEGDARRMETRYRASLSPRQRKLLDRAQKSETGQALKAMKQVPKVVITLVSAPYTLGEGLVQTVAAKGGNPGVDKLFGNAPTHESVLLDPFRQLAGGTAAADVDLPKLSDGEKKFDSGELGSLTWYLMLAERLPLTDALEAADGWSGDAYVAYERGPDSCARIGYRGRTPRGTARMYSSLKRWVAAAPGSPASVTRKAGVVTFQSCDPGKTARVGRDASEDAVALVTVRTSIGVSLMRAKAPQKLARCVAGRLVREYRVSQLSDPAFGTRDLAVQTRIRQIALGCR